MKKEKALELAENLIVAGKLDKALKSFQKLVAAHAEDLRLKLKLGDLYVRRKEIAEAIRVYQEVGAAYVKEKFHLKAIAIYKMILKLNPTLIEINEKLGDLYREVGMKKDALSQYFIVADQYEQINQTDRLLEVRKKIIEADPSAITSRIRLAEIYQKDGKLEDSLREYERVAEDLQAQNDQSGLIEVYEKILYYRPNQADNLVKLCRLYLERNEAQKAEQKIESAPAELQQHMEVLELALDISLKREQREKARRLLKNLIERCGEEKDQERASRLFGQAQKEFEDDEEYISEIATLLTQAGLAVPSPEEGVHPIDLEKTVVVSLDELEKQAKKKK